MKKHLKEELIALAEKIMQLKKQQVDVEHLKDLAQELYEKLTVLGFTEKHLVLTDASEEKEDKKSVASENEEEVPTFEEETDEYLPDGTQFNDSDAITEPNTEKIKDIVAQMEPETQQVDELFSNLFPGRFPKNEKEGIGGVHYDNLPQFEPLNSKSQESQKPKSLNDRLKKSIHIGVNDRHAFVKHLFDGSNSDYNRVLSQLNTIKIKEEAIKFVLEMVKPDYNNWEGKEEYEIRFLAIVENKFE